MFTSPLPLDKAADYRQAFDDYQRANGADIPPAIEVFFPAKTNICRAIAWMLSHPIMPESTITINACTP